MFMSYVYGCKNGWNDGTTAGFYPRIQCKTTYKRAYTQYNILKMLNLPETN